LSYKFLNIVAAIPAGDHGNPQGAEWLRQDASFLPGTASVINRKGSAPHRMPGRLFAGKYLRHWKTP
jgi:hypothetical protein